MNGYAQWNRESLYEVWQNPVSTVAENYGISDVALAKVCRKLRIPVPGRGYWARKAAGYKVKTVPLRSFANAPTLYHSVRPRTPKPSNDLSDPELRQIAEVEAKQYPAPNFQHPLIEQASGLLHHGKLDGYGRLQNPRNKRCVDICVSAELLDRALNAMNIVILGLEEEGLEVVASEDSTSVLVFGQTIRFGIEEDLQIKERREEPSYSGTKTVNVYERSGKIAFRIWSNATGARARWGDGKAKRLEQLLPLCIGGILRQARLHRLEDERRKAQAAEWERQRIEREERERNESEEVKRFEILEECASAWQRAQHIRDFICALEHACETRGESAGPETERGKWILWAREKADWLDPLTRL